MIESTSNILHLGDAFDYMDDMPSKSIPMIYGDLYFGKGKMSRNWTKKFDTNRMFDSFNRILAPEGVIIMHSFGIYTADLMNANRKNYKYSVIWEKDRTTGFYNAKKQPLRNHEDLLVFYKQSCTYNPIMTKDADFIIGSKREEEEAKYPRTVLRFNTVTPNKRLYPTQKPIGLVSHLILTYTNKGDVVFDPFCGSGTTAVSCIRTERQYICIDNSKKAINTSIERVREEFVSNEFEIPMFA